MKAMENGKTQRIDYLDTAKGIGIILVCIGHACTNQSKVQDCQFADIIRFVTLFHMALFFFINGMLYNEKYSQKPIIGIWKKLKAYYIPFIQYNLIFWLLHNCFAKLYLISGIKDEKDYPYVGMKSFVISFVKSLIGYRQRFAGAMWFLEALIVISLTFIVIDFVATKFVPKHRILVMSVLILLVVLVNRLLGLYSIPHVPESLTQMVYWGFNGLVFFYLGYLYKIYDCNHKLANKRWIFILLGFAILLGTVVLMRPKVVSVITNVSIKFYDYGMSAVVGQQGVSGLSLVQYVLYAAVCLCGILTMILLSQTTVVSGSKVLKICGRYSLHIMCLQFLAFKSVSYLIIRLYGMPLERLAEYPVLSDVNGLWWVAYSVSGCLLPILVVKLWSIVIGFFTKRIKGVV